MVHLQPSGTSLMAAVWACAAFGLSCAIVACDWHRRRIPNYLPGLTLLLGLVFWADAAGRLGLHFAAMGMLAGGAAGSIPYACGLCGAADVKVLAALCSWTGMPGCLPTLLWTALFGGLLCFVSKTHAPWHWRRALCRARRQGETVPYALAIVAGSWTTQLQPTWWS